jgi:uncharacterized membrane protein
MICSYCAREMPDISGFCPACGRPVLSFNELKAEDATECLMGAAAYFALVPAIVFLCIPATRARQFVRFHAWQSVFFVISAVILSFVFRLLFLLLSILPLAGSLLAWLSAGVGFLAVAMLWAVLVTKAAQGQAYELPWIGPYAYRLAQ